MVAARNSLSCATSSFRRVPDRPRAWGYRFLSWAGKGDASLRPGPGASRTQSYRRQRSLGVTQKQRNIPAHLTFSHMLHFCHCSQHDAELCLRVSYHAKQLAQEDPDQSSRPLRA